MLVLFSVSVSFFYTDPNSCAFSIMYFIFREKKADSWSVTQATWESTRCRSSQRHLGIHLHFLFNLFNNTIQMMSPVQSGSFFFVTSIEVIVLSSKS